MPYSAIASGIGTVLNFANNAINASENRKWNNYWNQKMLDFSKNAVSYNVADRLRSGLSPLDAGQSETPSLQGYEQPMTDYLQSGITNAVASAQREKELGMLKTQTDAKAYADYANGLDSMASAIRSQSTLSLDISKLQEQITKLREENKVVPESLQEELTNLKLRNEELQALIKSKNQEYNITARDENWYRSINMPNGQLPSNPYEWAFWIAKVSQDKQKNADAFDSNYDSASIERLAREHEDEILRGLTEAYEKKRKEVEAEAFRTKNFSAARAWGKSHPRPTRSNLNAYVSGKYGLDFF